MNSFDDFCLRARDLNLDDFQQVEIDELVFVRYKEIEEDVIGVLESVDPFCMRDELLDYYVSIMAFDEISFGEFFNVLGYLWLQEVIEFENIRLH